MGSPYVSAAFSAASRSPRRAAEKIFTSEGRFADRDRAREACDRALEDWRLPRCEPRIWLPGRLPATLPGRLFANEIRSMLLPSTWLILLAAAETDRVRSLTAPENIFCRL